MKEALFKKRLELQKQLDNNYKKMKQLEAEKFNLDAQIKLLDREIELEMMSLNTNTITIDKVKFILDRDITTTILKSNRDDAIKYNNKFKLGLFNLVLNGMRLKKWVRELWLQNVPIPAFVSYEVHPKIKIEYEEK